MLQETLKEATQADHDTLEGLMFVHQIMGGTLSMQQYKQILTTNYLVHKRFEDILVNGLDAATAQQLNVTGRRKLDALATDLLELKMDAPDPQADDITFSNQAEILGAFYVLEGATLGGNVIVKRLKVNPQLSCLSFHYYQFYGENLIPNWKKFVEVLNNQRQDTYNDSINGAKKMFGYIAAVQKQNNAVSGN